MTCYEYRITEEVYVPLIQTTSSVIKNLLIFSFMKSVWEEGERIVKENLLEVFHLPSELVVLSQSAIILSGSELWSVHCEFWYHLAEYRASIFHKM